MKKLVLSLSFFVLATAVQAQFTFKTVEGKTIGTTARPDYQIPFSDCAKKTWRGIYLTWEKERVVVFEATYWPDDTLKSVEECHLYYNGFDTKGFETGINEGTLFIRHKEGWAAALYEHDESASSCVAKTYAQLNFPGAEQRKAFVSELTERKLALSLDLDYTPGPPPVIKEFTIKKKKEESDNLPVETPTKSVQSEEKPQKGGSPSPAKPTPPAPKKLEEVSVRLFNKSANIIEIVIKHGRGSSTITSLNPRNSRRFELKVGAEVRLKGSNQLLLTITEKMHDTEQVIAK